MLLRLFAPRTGAMAMAKKPALADQVGWKLENQLGQGGQGDVFLAVRKAEPDGPKYAFKFLNNDANATALARFRQELDALTSINHPGIVKVIEHSKEGDGFQYYVMEYVDGSRPLHKLIGSDDNPFFKNPLKAVDGFIQIVEALAACEQRRIVHRDLSPANVLVTKDERIILIDFGLCHIDSGHILTMTGEAVGTPHYRAPECSGYTLETPTIRADLYSAGKILWSMITNQPVFEREAPVFNALSLAKILPDISLSWHLHHIFKHTIRHDAAKRYDNTFNALQGARNVCRLIIDEYQPLEQLADTLCPLCGVGRYGDSMNLIAYYREQMEEFGRAMAPLRGCYSVCPFCFHASFVAREGLEKALEDRRGLL
jgi:serine/threonine protein kinase